MTIGLLCVTVSLVLFGCILYVADAVGWAQLLWVLASGSAGGAITSWADDRKPR